MRSIVIVLLLAIATHGVSIKWTGYQGNGQWSTQTNWYPDQVPGASDDVTIEKGSVTASQAAECNSLTMGTSFNEAANLTIQSSFFVGGSNGLYVDDNGNLFLSGGASVTGVVNVDGSLYFQNGVVTGQVTVSKKGDAYLTGPGARVFSGCNFVVNGPISIAGNLQANLSSVITVSGAATISGSTNLQVTDTSSNLYDFSNSDVTFSGSDFSIYAPTNFGSITIASGNITIYDVVNFNDALEIPANSYVTTLTPSAVVNISAGVTGAGVLSNNGNWLTLGGMNMTGYFNAVGGNTTIAADAAVGILTFAGGTVVVDHKITAGQLNLINGLATGTAHLKSPSVLVKGNGFFVDASIFSLGTTYVDGKTQLNFKSNGLFWASQTNSMTIATGSSLLIIGNPGNQGFTNDGTIVAMGSFASNNVNIGGTGTVNISSSLRIGTITFTQDTVNLSGTGVFRGSSSGLMVNAVNGAPYVKATIGSYSFKCAGGCDSVKTSTNTPASAFTFAISSTQDH